MMAIRNSRRRFLYKLGLVCLGTVVATLIFSVSHVTVAADDKATDDKAVEQIGGDKRIAVLRFLAAHNEANYRKIETWRGKYHFVDRSPQKIQLAVKQKLSPQQAAKQKLSLPPFEIRDVIMIREGTVEFALDVAADKLWSEYREDESKTKFLSLDGKETITPLKHRPVIMKEILTADRLTKFSDAKHGPLPQHPDDPNHLRKTMSRLARRDAYRINERIRDTGQRLDPRRFYSFGTVLTWEDLNYGIKALTGGNGEEIRKRNSRVLKIAKHGDAGEYEYKKTMRFFSGRPEDETEGLAMDVIRFAERDQYLPIEQTFYSRKGELHQRRSWVYQRTNDILIPKEFHFTMNDAGNGKLVLDRHLRFVEGVLNEPLPVDIFSTDHLGLTKGERLEDKVENKIYVSDGKKLLPAPQYAAIAPDRHIAPRRRSVQWFLAGLSGFLFIVLAVLWVWRRFRSPRSTGGA